MVENVLLITIDSWRADYFLRDVPRDGATSTIEELAAEGESFSRAFATGPGTTPSFPALLTGTLPLSYGGLGPLTSKRPAVSTSLRTAGLSTAGFNSNPFLSTHFNYDVGFDVFEDYQNPLMGIATRVFPRGIEISNPKLRRVDEILHLTDAIKSAYHLVMGKPRPYVSAEVITDDILQWLSRTESSFFCWTHYMDVHHPCFPPPEYRERYGAENVTQSEVSEWYSALLREPEKLTGSDIRKLKALYVASIDYTDDQIRRILDRLKEIGRYEDTLVIVTSDHGELFGEHDQYGKPERMYDELLHVPLVITNGPGYLADVTDHLVSLLDLPPLIHDALGLDVPDEYEGRIPGKDEPRDLVMAEHEVRGDVIVGARSENWLYEGDEIDEEHRLYDLRDGGFERLTANRPDATAVREAVIARLDELDVVEGYLQGDIDDGVEDRLKNLGYL